MHHKVHFYDEVVENIIVHLLAEGELNSFLKDLIYLLALKSNSAAANMKKKRKHLEALQSLLVTFDDPWLESRIRSIYRHNVEAGDGIEKEFLFEAYVESRKRFVSAFKSDYEFWEAVGDYAPRLGTLKPRETAVENNKSLDSRAFFSMFFTLLSSPYSHYLNKNLDAVSSLGPLSAKLVTVYVMKMSRGFIRLMS